MRPRIQRPHEPVRIAALKLALNDEGVAADRKLTPVRGVKKKLGLTIEATRTRAVGPNKTGAKGSTTIYRIV